MEKESPEKEKPSKITDKDWKKVEEHLKAEFDKRKTATVRVRAEEKWKEVDRQVSMGSMNSWSRDGSSLHYDEDWHSAIELGELSQASHDITAEVIRIIFPNNRAWFEPHTKLPLELDQATGARIIESQIQETQDKRVRAYMMQQHKDFGLKDRVRLGIREALHHSAFVFEVKEETQEMYFGDRVKEFKAPVLVPHSMWNCYPDMSPSIIGTNMFYTGTMFIKSYMPGYKVKEMMAGQGWMPSQIRKITKQEHKSKDVMTQDWELLTYWGDILIKKGDDSIYLPNHKAILANGVIIYLKENDTPYIPIIYRTWERIDIRDPYGMSPIIKMSPMQKIASISTNKFNDALALKVEPPVVYDANDPQFAANGGPVIAPGALAGTKGQASFKQIEIGDPKAALDGVQFAIEQIRRTVGGNTLSAAAVQSSRASATEVNKVDQDEEIGLVDFIDGLETALRAYLYMQHHLNLNGSNYTFYNPELGALDFDVMTKKELPDDVHFDVVGARGVLGEMQRRQGMIQAVGFLGKIPDIAAAVDWIKIGGEIFSDFGVTHPERFFKVSDNIPPQVKAQMQKLMQAVQVLQQKLKDSESQNQVKLQKAGMDHQAKMAKIEVTARTALAEIEADLQKVMAELSVKQDEGNKDRELAALDIAAKDIHKRHDQLIEVIKATDGNTQSSELQGTAGTSGETPPGGA